MPQLSKWGLIVGCYLMAIGLGSLAPHPISYLTWWGGAMSGIGLSLLIWTLWSKS